MRLVELGCYLHKGCEINPVRVFYGRFSSFDPNCLLAGLSAAINRISCRNGGGTVPRSVSHGFLVLRTPEGKPIADGDSTQVARGDRVTSRLQFRFKDGSIYEESTVFSQHGASDS